MKQPRSWYWESALLFLIVLGTLLLGQWTGRILPLLLITVSAYCLWHLLQLYRFNRWLGAPKRYSPPVEIGIWRSVFGAAESLRERGRKRKRKLRRVLNGFQESTSALPDATVVLNDRLEMEWWNKAAKGMLGLERKKDHGRQIDDVISDPIFKRYLERGDYTRPLQVPAPVDDSTSLEVRIVPYGEGKRLLQARDITRLLQLETVRRDFVANVSHEMRTPLTVIHGYLETMGESGSEELAPWDQAIEQMRQQTGRMQRIVEDLLVLSRLESDQQPKGQEVVDVPLLLQSIVTEGLRLSRDKHRITLNVDQPVKLYANLSEVESAFSNLLFNAVRYTPPGGEIALRWWDGEEGACLQVSDNGIGIEAEHLPRLTERFYRVDVGRSRQSGGTGLGLAIVKHVLIRLGGRLTIESEPGEGSSFTCCFPPFRSCKQ